MQALWTVVHDTLPGMQAGEKEMIFSQWMRSCPQTIAAATVSSSQKMAVSLQSFCSVVAALGAQFRQRADASIDSKCSDLLKMCDQLVETHLPQVFEETRNCDVLGSVVSLLP